MNMNRFAGCIATLSLALVAGPAFADQLRFENNQIGYEVIATPGTVSRAQVIADLQRAQRDGTIRPSYEYPQPPHFAPSAKSHEQVQREAANASERERGAQKMLYWPIA